MQDTSTDSNTNSFDLPLVGETGNIKLPIKEIAEDGSVDEIENEAQVDEAVAQETPEELASEEASPAEEEPELEAAGEEPEAEAEATEPDAKATDKEPEAESEATEPDAEVIDEELETEATEPVAEAADEETEAAEEEPEAKAETTEPEAEAAEEGPVAETAEGEVESEAAEEESVAEEGDQQASETEEPQVEEQTVATSDMPDDAQATKVKSIPLDAGLDVMADTPFVAEQPAEAPAEEAKDAAPKKRIKPWMIAAAIALALGLGFGGYQIKLSGDYNKAVELYEQGDYAGASEAFGALGNYKDAQSYYDLASKWFDAETKEKSASTDPAKWTEAAKAYELIDDAEAKKKAQHCKDASTYYTAMNLLADGSEDRKVLQEALELFQSANGVFDADAQVANCQDGITILDVKDLMGQKKWADAIAKLDSLSDPTFNNAKTLRLECEAWQQYDEAEALFNGGKYYEAYVKFNSIVNPGYEGFPNLEERAKACIQGFPASGVVYRNGSYQSDDCQLTIDNSGYTNCYYKLYIGDDLVMSVFVPENGKETFMLPSGTYHMNKGYGEQWFGTEDMFGDDGRYWKCSFGGSDTFTLDYGWAYEISTGGEGTGISTSSTDRGSM